MSKLKQNYQKAVTLLVELASLQTSFITLDEVKLEVHCPFLSRIFSRSCANDAS